MIQKYLVVRHSDRVHVFKKHKSLEGLIKENWFMDNDTAWQLSQSIRIDGTIHSPTQDKLIICNDEKVVFYKFE